MHREDLEMDYRITGGWAVDGILGKVSREHDNIDVMLLKGDVPKFKEELEKYGMEIRNTGSGRLINLRAEGAGVVVDAIVLYPIEDYDGYLFETPYHNPGAPIPKSFLKGRRVNLQRVNFTALNPTALYFAKITAKETRKRDMEDARKLAPFVDKNLREQMKFYALSY